MNCAPHRAESWVRHHDRLLLSDTEQFLAAPVAVLLNRSGVNNIRQPAFGLELRLLIDRNAVGDGTFVIPPPSSPYFQSVAVAGFPTLTTGPNVIGNPSFAVPQPPLKPWTLGALWALTAYGTARKTAGGTAALEVLGAVVETSEVYKVSFTIRNRTAGSIYAIPGNGDAGEFHSANGTVTEILTAGAQTKFALIPSSDFAGEITNVTVYKMLAAVDPPQPWVYGAEWSYTGLGSARKRTGGTAALDVLACLVVGASYSVTFTLTNYIGGGTVTPTCGTTAGTARSANGTFTETIACGVSNGFHMVPNGAFAGDISNVIVTPATAPGDLTVNLYVAADALAAFRSTEPFAAIVLPAATKTLIRHLRWVDYSASCSGFDVGLDLAAGYTAGKVYASAWTRRYWWGQPASPG